MAIARGKGEKLTTFIDAGHAASFPDYPTGAAACFIGGRE
jgi:hypothetical protein